MTEIQTTTQENNSKNNEKVSVLMAQVESMLQHETTGMHSDFSVFLW
jgi:hypothetical protein